MAVVNNKAKFQFSTLYTAYKPFKDNSLYLAFNTKTLDLYLIDVIFFSLLNRNYPLVCKDLINDYCAEANQTPDFVEKRIYQLIDNGLLTLDKDQKPNCRKTNCFPLKQINKKFAPKTLYLSIVQDCNLRCTYCSAGYGRFGGSIKYMDKKIARKSIDLLFSDNDDIKDRGVIFAGGEPLLNLDVLLDTLDYGNRLSQENKKDIYFSFNTNGTLLTEDIALKLSLYPVYATFSIDGTKKIHDSHRKFKNGDVTYDLAVKNFKKYCAVLKKTRKYFHSRVQACLPFGEGLYDAYLNLKDIGASMLIINPTWPSAFLNHNLTIKLTDIDRYLNEYQLMLDDQLKQMEEIEGGSYCFMASTLTSFNNLAERKPKSAGCGAGNNGFAISSDGDIYPCALLLENKEYLIGNIFNNINSDRMTAIQQQVMDFSLKCSNCWAKALCGASCLAMAIAQHAEDGKEPTPFCKLFKGYMEKDIINFAKIRLKNGSHPYIPEEKWCDI